MSKTKTKRVLAGMMAALLALGSVPAMASSAEEAGDADLEEVSGYTATLEQSEGGSLAFHDAEGDSAVFSVGDTVTVDIQPDDGFEVFLISVTDSKDGRTGLYEECVADQYSFTMPAADVIVRAEFTEIIIPEEEMTMEAEGEDEAVSEDETVSEDESPDEEDMAVKVLSLSVADIAPYSVSVGDSVYTQSSRHIDGTTAGMVYQYDDSLDDGYSKAWHASYMYVNGEASAVFCIDADTDFEDGYKTVYDAASYFSDTLLSQIAIGQVWIDDYCKENSVANNIKYLLKQCYTWRRISNSQNLDYDQMMIDYSLISKSAQESVYTNALQYAKDNKDRYTYGGYVYIGEGQSLASFWAEPLPENGYLTLEKASANTAITDGNSCYSFKGIQYQVYADSSCSEKAVDADGANALLTVDASGTSNTLELETGTYWVKEIADSVTGTGYAADSGVYKASVSEESTEDVPVVLSVSDIPQSNPVSILLRKTDADTGNASPSGDASLAGAEFEISYYDGYYTKASEVSGKSAVRTWVVKTDEDGVAKLSSKYLVSGELYYNSAGDPTIPLGTVTVKETSAPEGYAMDESIHVIPITASGTAEKVDVYNEPTFAEPVIRGGVAVQKRDVQSLRDEPQGNASFEGITLEITNDSENAVLVDGVLYDPGEVVLTLITDETGYAETAADALPYGTYTIAETEVPGSESRVEGDGYLLGNGSHDTAAAQANTSIRFTIEEDGVIVDLTGDEGSAIDPEDGITDQVKRGDIALVKHRADTQSAMGSVKFEITSLTTGESHIFWTDENGNYSSDSTWNKHSYNTNAGEDWTDGIWFYGYADGEESGEEVDDSLGALPADDYRLDELPCEANEGMELYHGTFSVYEDIRVIDLNIIYNEPEEVYSAAWLRSQAWAGDTGTQISYANGYVTLYDDIFYYGLEPGVEYHIYGVALDAETREPEYDHYGEKICALTTFTPTEPDGMEVQEFYFDVEDLSGRRVVFYETIYMIDEDGNAVLVAAEDVADAPNETIYFPDVGTTLVDAESGEHVTRAGDTVTLVDTVTVTEVPEGESLIVYGTLMNKSTGEALLDADGNPVTAYTEFVSAGLDPQTVELEFVFDASSLAGNAVVAFEDLYLVIDEETLALVGRHADLEDEGQTVEFAPEIHTTLTDAETGTHEAVADGTIVLNDVVRYEGLTPGEEYVVSGILMDKETGEELLDADGKEITAESEPFVPEKADGEVTVTFTFDSEDLAGISAVAFEYLYDVNGELAASHEDLTDEDQTVDLIEKETPPVETETPEETPTETPEGTITDVPTTVSTGSPTTATETTTTTRPKTGDTRTVWPLVCVIGAAGVGIAVLVRKRFGVKA